MIWHDGISMARKLQAAFGHPHGARIKDVAMEFLFWTSWETELQNKSRRGGPNTLYWWYPEGFSFYTTGDGHAPKPEILIRLAGWRKHNPVVFTIRDATDARYFWLVFVPKMRKAHIAAQRGLRGLW